MTLMFNFLRSYKPQSCFIPFQFYYGILPILISTLATFYPINTQAFPSRSTQVEEKGLTAVESPLPWISGWDLSQQAVNVKDLLSSKSKLGFKGAYLILCATWEPKCSETLKFINRQRGQLIEAEINVIAIFTENISPDSLSKWLAKHKLAPHEHLSILIDRYHRSAIRTGAFEDEKVSLINSEETDSPNSDKPKINEKVKRLRLPLGLIVSSDGMVLSIISQAGADLVKIITQTVRYAGEE